MTEHKKINILYLHNNSQISGGERSLMNLWENLDLTRFELFLIVPAPGDLTEIAKKLNISVSYLSIEKLTPLQFVSVVKAFFQLRKFVLGNQIKIIHSYSPRNNILSALLGRMHRIPVIWHERNLVYGEESSRSKQFWRLPSSIICNSGAVAELFRINNNIPSKVQVVLNGVNCKRFVPDDSKNEVKRSLGITNEKVVGIVTNLSKRKRIEFFLEIAAQIVKEFENVKFVVVGGEFPDESGKRIDEIKTHIKNLGIEECVILTDFKRDVNPFVNIFDVFVHVAIKEACSRAILEAMAVGKPTIVTNDGGNPELVENNQTGVLVNSYDPETFINVIVELLRNDNKCLEMGKRARERVETHFDVKRNAQQTQQIYDNLLSKHS